MMKSLTFNDCYKEKLFSIPLFSELPDYLKSEILKRLDFRLQEINENTVILEQGDICCNLYVLLEGTLEVNIIDANGNEVLIEHIEYEVTQKKDTLVLQVETLDVAMIRGLLIAFNGRVTAGAGTKPYLSVVLQPDEKPLELLQSILRAMADILAAPQEEASGKK